MPTSSCKLVAPWAGNRTDGTDVHTHAASAAILVERRVDLVQKDRVRREGADARPRTASHETSESSSGGWVPGLQARGATTSPHPTPRDAASGVSVRPAPGAFHWATGAASRPPTPTPG